MRCFIAEELLIKAVLEVKFHHLGSWFSSRFALQNWLY